MKKIVVFISLVFLLAFGSFKTFAEETPPYIELSELELDSYSVGWGELEKNQNIEKGTISLNIGGERVYFSTGIGAHATSTLVYDLESYKEYTTLSGYLGVDYTKGGMGDGVKFTISLSNDKSSWVPMLETLSLKGNSEAVKIDIHLEGYRYLKLYADKVGKDEYDHSVYAGIRLVKEASTASVPFQTLEEYDAIISGVDFETAYSMYKKLIYEREFVRRIGYQTLLVAYEDEKMKAGIDYILSSIENLELFIESGSLFDGQSINTLKALGNLYDAYKDIVDENPIYKKMMIATSVAYCKTIKSYTTTYGGNSKASDPVVKFSKMKYIYDHKLSDNIEEFEQYPQELIRMVMDARMEDDEILWLNQYANSIASEGKNKYSGYSYMEYVNTGYNKKEFNDIENLEYYKDKYKLDLGDEELLESYGVDPTRYRLWMLFEAGGICWGISGCGTNVAEVNLIPATNMYQPGHDAYMIYKKDENGNGIWEIWNNISGFKESYTRWGNNQNSEARIPLDWGMKDYNNFNKNNASYLLLAQRALNDYENYQKANLYNLLANSYLDSKKEEIYLRALEIQSFNLDSIDGLIDVYKKTKDKDSMMDLVEKVIDAYLYYPLPFSEAMDRIKANVESEELKVELDILKNNGLKYCLTMAEDDVLQSNAQKEVAKYLLNSKSTISLAGFSFSGENKNTIRIDSSYDDYNFMVKYSFDGGKTEVQTTSHEIELSEEQLKQITSDNDIYVGIVGSNEWFIIDILDGKSILDNELYCNDDENRFIGKIENLEYSYDDIKYFPYDATIRFSGDQEVYLRYQASGVSLTGESRMYSFTLDRDTKEEAYYSIDNIELVSVSSYQGGREGSNAIDGSINTTWHTQYGKIDEEKEITLKLKEASYLSKVEYVPAGGSNGRLKNGIVYGSMDGVSYYEIARFDELANTQNSNTISFPATLAYYVKVKALDTYGNYPSEENMYFSCKMMNFYIDETQSYSDAILVNTTYKNYSSEVEVELSLPLGAEIVEYDEINPKKNGVYKVKYKNYLGEVLEQIITIDGIDDIAPTARIQYIRNTDNCILARVVDASEDVIFLDDISSYLFTENGSYIFTFYDYAGNEATLIAEVSDIKEEINISLEEAKEIENVMTQEQENSFSMFYIIVPILLGILLILFLFLIIKFRKKNRN